MRLGRGQDDPGLYGVSGEGGTPDPQCGTPGFLSLLSFIGLVSVGAILLFLHLSEEQNSGLCPAYISRLCQRK